MWRDSAIWWASMAGGVAVALCGHYVLLQKAFPGLSPAWEGRIELFAFVWTVVSAKVSLSPLPLSPKGKQAAKDGKL